MNRVNQRIRMLAWTVAAMAPAFLFAQTPKQTGTSTTAAATRPTVSTRPSTTRPSLPPLLTQEEIVAMHKGGDHEGALKEIDRVLSRRGPSVAEYDRYSLLMIKGDALLALKRIKHAADTYQVAANVAKDDEVKSATARAISRIVTDSKGSVVKQRHPTKGVPPETADLLDPAGREVALRIFRDDLRADAKPKVKDAFDAETVPPITQAIDLLWLKRDFEIATEGVDDESLAARKKLVERLRTLMGQEMDRMEALVDQIWETASTVKYQGYSRRNDPNSNLVTVYRGLTNTDRADLKTVLSTCARIPPTVAGIKRATGEELSSDRQLVSRAKDLSRVASGVLSNRYQDP